MESEAKVAAYKCTHIRYVPVLGNVKLHSTFPPFAGVTAPLTEELA
jgi:hypothetical protein